MSFSDGAIKERLLSFASSRGMQLVKRLGFGKDGSVWSTTALTAVKVFERPTAFATEAEVYKRLASEGITEILGHSVPELKAVDDRLEIIELSIVKPPFLLDFANAILDFPTEFPDEIMQEWLATKQEEFGKNWAHAAMILTALERLGIYMLDVHPGNIGFANSD